MYRRGYHNVINTYLPFSHYVLSKGSMLLLLNTVNILSVSSTENLNCVQSSCPLKMICTSLAKPRDLLPQSLFGARTEDAFRCCCKFFNAHLMSLNHISSTLENAQTKFLATHKKRSRISLPSSGTCVAEVKSRPPSTQPNTYKAFHN